VREVGQGGDLPIHRACLNKTAAAHSIMRAVIDAAPEMVSVPGRDRALPLHISCSNTTDIKCVKDLIAMYPGAAAMRSGRGDFPAHHAAINQSLANAKIMKYTLLPFQDAVKAAGSQGDLPLHMACAMSTNAAVVRELISCYANGLCVRNAHGDLPVHRVALNTRPDAAAILMEVLAATHPIAKGVVLFPEAVRELGQGGNTALHIACSDSNSVMVVRELIFRYPEAAKLANDKGDLPAHCAAMNQSKAAADILKSTLAAYPEAIHTKGCKGNLPLHYAAKYSPSLEAIQDTIKRYHDAVCKKNDLGELPAFSACNNKSEANAAIQEEIFKEYPNAFGEKDDAKLHLQVKSIDDTFFPWHQPKAIQAELRDLLSGKKKAANRIDMNQTKPGSKISADSCLLTGRFWVGGLCNEV